MSDSRAGSPASGTRPVADPPRGEYEFAGYRFSAATGELTGPRGSTRLQPQPAIVLRTLLTHADRVVTRAELQAAVWGDAHVEADQGLNYCLRQIRRAFGDDDGAAAMIETLPKRGYRVTVPVIETGGAPLDHRTSPISPSDPLPAPSASPRAPARVGVLLVVALLVTAAVAAAVVAGVLRRGPGSTEDVGAVPVAILPLRSPEEPRATTEPWVSALDGGVTDELVALLSADSAAPALAVVGPVTTRGLERSAEPHTALGRRLEVRFVISGGVRPSDTTLFIQAVRSRDGAHVFAWRQPVRGRSGTELARLVAPALSARLRTAP